MRDLQVQSIPDDSGILIPALDGARVTAARLCAAGRVAEASVVLSGDLTGGPEDVPLLYELAQIRLRQRDAVGAITLLENAATLAPLDGELHFALATACVCAGRRERAEAVCRLAVQAEPTHGRAQNLLGWLVMERGDATAALTHFRDALRHDPHSVDVQLNTGTALIRTGDYASARTLCEAMSERAPGHAGVWIQLGLACKALRDDAAARTAFQRAGASPIARVQLGQLALVHGDPTKVSPAPLVRVHLVDTLRDLLGIQPDFRTWSLRAALQAVAAAENGVVVMLRQAESPRMLADAVAGRHATVDGRFGTEHQDPAAPVLRTYGVGAQILKDLGVSRMRVLSAPKQLHGISAFGLEIESYVDADT